VACLNNVAEKSGFKNNNKNCGKSVENQHEQNKIIYLARMTLAFLRTGGGPPGVLFYKRFFYIIFLKFILNFKNFFPNPRQKFMGVSYP